MSPRRAAVLGWPIAHSRSPQLHRAAYAALGLDWLYDGIEMTPDRLPDFVARCAGPAWVGLSLTMPLKSDVLPLLDDTSEIARQVGAANTVVFDGARRIGHNTDVPGMRAALEGAAGGSFAPRSGSIIGGGATARSAVAALVGMGVGQVEVVVREPARAQPVAALAQVLGASCEIHAWPAAGNALRSDVVVSTVPAGVADALSDQIPRSVGVLLDVAYGHGESPLVRQWREVGGSAADGLDLLLWQAADQVRLFTGLEPPISAMRSALAAES